MCFNKGTWTIVSVHKNHIRRPDSIMKTKQLYRLEIYFIRKHEQPWPENIKYHFPCVSHSFFKTCSMNPLAFVAVWLQGHWWGFISRNYVVWPTFLLMNVFIALKGSHFWFLFDFTAAGVVPCGGRKTSPRTSTIVQFIFYFGPLRSAIIFWEIRNKWLV